MKTALKDYIRTKTQKYTQCYVSIVLVLLCLAVLLIVPTIRETNQSFIGQEAYSHLRLSKGLSLYDQLSFGGRFTSYSLGLPFVISIMPDQLTRFIPLVLGVMSFIIFSLLLKNIKYTANCDTVVTLIVLLISPPFIYLFSTLNNKAPAIFLALFGFYIFQKNNKFLLPIASLILLFVPLFSIVISIITVILLGVYVFCNRENKNIFYLVLSLTLIAIFVYLMLLVANMGLPEIKNFAAYQSGVNFFFQRVISDFGAVNGLGIFGVLISFFGIAACWKNKYSNPFAFFSFLILVLLTLFKSEPIFFLNLFLSFFVAKGLAHLFRRGWESQVIKFLTVTILVCGLLFSGVSQVNKLINEKPSKEIIEALSFLNQQEKGVVFAHYTRGFWISYAGKSTVMDANFFFAPHLNERWKDSQELFHTRDLKIALSIIDKYKIKYIWTDQEMKSMIWNEEEEGLQFVLKYSKIFRKIYENQEVEIWQVEQ